MQKILLNAIFLLFFSNSALAICYESEAPLANVSRAIGIRKCLNNEKVLIFRPFEGTVYNLERTGVKIEYHKKPSVAMEWWRAKYPPKPVNNHQRNIK